MHITTLNPHTASHPPHTHPNEEMVIVREGTLQAHVNGKEVVVGPGGVLFYASMQPHAVQNIGDTPATYFVINWASPRNQDEKDSDATQRAVESEVVRWRRRRLLLALRASPPALQPLLALFGRGVLPALAHAPALLRRELFQPW